MALLGPDLAACAHRRGWLLLVKSDAMPLSWPAACGKTLSRARGQGSGPVAYYRQMLHR